ncbi:hypothetical protein [Neisseria sp. S1]|uniref:hypothetical protein n=1 Tax=Neisseria sp. S1 TaxID=3318354 RepID=UPI003A855CC0
MPSNDDKEDTAQIFGLMRILKVRHRLSAYFDMCLVLYINLLISGILPYTPFSDGLTIGGKASVEN